MSDPDASFARFWNGNLLPSELEEGEPSSRVEKTVTETTKRQFNLREQERNVGECKLAADCVATKVASTHWFCSFFGEHLHNSIL